MYAKSHTNVLKSAYLSRNVRLYLFLVFCEQFEFMIFESNDQLEPVHNDSHFTECI